MKMQILMLAALAATAATAAPAAEPTPIQRENIEWCDIWITDGGKTVPNRVLLVGDSITRGYYSAVATKLAGKASVSRLATSKCLCDPAYLEELKLVLSQYPFEIVHFNNGLHGWGYTEQQYREHFPALLATLHKYAPKAKLIWGTSTPMRVAGHLDQINENTKRILERNKIALEFVTHENIPVDDLYALSEGHPEYYTQDGTHHNQTGVAAQADQVAAAILKLIP